MPSSTVSLEPLSSPSPSPQPPPYIDSDSDSNHSGDADSLNDLSSLTEDDQENGDHHAEDEKPRPTRGRRKKRGGIVPAPMWDWAYKNKKGDSVRRNDLLEEEEEEEQAGPVEAMEEEEDEGRDDDDDTPARISPDVHAKGPLPNHAEDEDEEPDEEDVPEEEDDLADDVVDVPPLIRSAVKASHEADLASDDEEGEAAGGPGGDDAPPSRPVARITSPDISDDENAEEEPTNAEADVDEDEPQDPDPGADSDEDAEPVDLPLPNGTNAATISIPAPTTNHKVTTITVAASASKVDAEGLSTPMDVDEDTPVPTVLPIAMAVSQSSIMAGAEVVIPPSPSSSSSSASGSPHASPSPSRSRSPSAELASEPELDSKQLNGRVAAKGKAAVNKTQIARLTRHRSRRKMRGDETLELEGGDEGPLGAEDRDVGDPEEADGNSPDLELETDVLPVHRAEALDVLAQIELQFALAREQLYVNKMEGLAWEEALIAEDNHPEMIQLHAELDKRRNKRLDLASRRRDFEVANITKRRKLDENGIWSWWKVARDDLQAEMTSEMTRRRRKLDRERRNLDRPLPSRIIPGPPAEILVARTVYEIVKGDPFNAPRSSKARKQDIPPQHLVYPQLTSLSHADIVNDVQLMYLPPRPVMYDPGLQSVIRPGQVVEHPYGIHPAQDHYNPGIGIMDSRLGSGPPPSMQHLPPPHMTAPPGYLVPPTQTGTHHMAMDIDPGGIGRPPSVLGHPNHQQFPPIVYPPGNLTSRSISPVLAYSNGQAVNMGGMPSMTASGSRQPQGWMAEGGLPPSSHGRPNGGEYNGLDREKYRDRGLVSKDRTERDREDHEGYHNQLAPARHIHTRPHIHPPGHTAGPHRHVYHHHHVLHYHHRPTAANGADGNGPLSDRVPALNGVAGPSSPRMQELELHRPRSGAPTEVIDLLAASTKQTPASGFWKGNEDQLLPVTDRDFGRGVHIPPSASPHERKPPSVMGIPPYPLSPQHGHSTAPGSKAPSRRGSFSAVEESGPRPSSSHSHPAGSLGSHHQSLAASTSSHRQTPNNHSGRLHTSPMLHPQHSSSMVSPRSNLIRLPPLSPSNASPMVGNMRSPPRMNQSLPPPPLPPLHSQSSSKPPSPVDMRRRTPPPPLQARSPLTRESQSHSGHPRTSSPMVMLPPSTSMPNPILPRLPPVNLSEKHSPHLSKMKAQAVPIDGS